VRNLAFVAIVISRAAGLHTIVISVSLKKPISLESKGSIWGVKVYLAVGSTVSDLVGSKAARGALGSIARRRLRSLV